MRFRKKNGPGEILLFLTLSSRQTVFLESEEEAVHGEAVKGKISTECTEGKAAALFTWL